MLALFYWLAVASTVLAGNAEGPPEITEHPLDVIVAKGEPATLNCAAKDATEYLWYKDGEPVVTAREEPTSHRLVLNNGALFLLRVHNGKSGKEADSGTYYCVARNKYGETRSREASLKIAMLRDDFRTRPRNVQSVIGGRAVLECSPPKGFPEPVVSWRKDERELSPDSDERITLHPSGNLVIENVQRSDSGFFQCVARNMVGEKLSNPARLSVYEKPSFQQKPNDVTTDVASSVLFDCRVSGDPMPVIVWRKKDGKMPLGRAQILEGKGLRIDRVVPSDEGEYVCQAKNPAGAIETSARLTVHAPPSFDRQPVDETAEEGGEATFACEAAGNPLPARFWSKEGHQELMFPGHVSSDGRIKVSTQGQLTIAGVRVADQGYYVCSALNAAGSNIAKAYLKVSGRALLTNPPPIIEHGHANQTLALRASAILPCQAIGQTSPRISWLKNGQPLEVNAADSAAANRFAQLTTGSLQISDLAKTDSGVYTCKAKNADGETTWTASLLVEEHDNPKAEFRRMPDAATFPSAPGKPTVTNTTETTATLEWTAPDKYGASPVVGYILQYYSPEIGQTWYNVPDYIRDPKFVVKNLQSGHSYAFVVRAENEHGISVPSPVSNIVRTRGVKSADDLSEANANLDLDLARKRLGAEQLIKLLEVKSVNATAMKLSWRQKRTESLIQGFYIKWRGPSSPERNWVNVTNPTVSSYTVGGLLPYTTYAFFIIPYHKTVEGVPSNSLDGTTDEAPPSAAAADVRVRMMNMTTLRISWRPPPPEKINGLLRGFQIVVLGNATKFNRNISTNERAASVTLFHLLPGMTYKVSVAAKTGAGIGVFHGEDTVTMDRETLERHLKLANGESGHEQLMRIVKTPWFIAGVGVLLWIALMALIVVIYWRRKKAKGKASARLGMPFIKINDGSVHMTARDALWMDHTNYNSAQRSLLLGNTLNTQRHAGAVYEQDGREYYLMDAAPPPDYPGLPGQNPHVGTLNRSQSPNHYHYAALTAGPQSMSTFYPSHMDDPSPYATTTLVMGANRHKWLHDHMLRGPVVPPAPPPSGPPPGFAGHHTVGKAASNSTQSDSPPNTDISYVHSSDGTGGSSNGVCHAGGSFTASRRTPKQTLMDFIPPPPPGVPPPTTSAPVRRRDPPPEDYDSVNEALLRYRSSSPLEQPLVERTRFPAANTRGRDASRNGAVERQFSPAFCDVTADSQRSSLMCSTADNRSCSSEADEENSEEEDFQAALHKRVLASPQPPPSEYAATGARPIQPCMGVSASALTQSSYDSTSALRGGGKLKTLPRNGRKDFV